MIIICVKTKVKNENKYLRIPYKNEVIAILKIIMIKEDILVQKGVYEEIHNNCHFWKRLRNVTYIGKCLIFIKQKDGFLIKP